VQRGEQEGVLVGRQAELVPHGRVHAGILRVFYIFCLREVENGCVKH
jgi:hypothetical protein